MECFECKGVGLVNKTQDGEVYGQDVCHVCKGTGFIGEKPAETPVKITKKVTKK